MEGSDYHGRDSKSTIVEFNMSLSEKTHNKGYLSLATKVLKGFSPGVFSRL